MPRVQTADPRVPLGEQHILQVRPVFQAIGETTRSPKSVGCYAQPLLHRDGAHANVLVYEPRGRFALSQPRRAIEAVLGPAHLSSLAVYMIVSMIADAMAQLHDLLEPGDAGMLENTADDKKVHLPVRRGDPAGGAYCVLFGCFVQISFLVIPLRLFPGRIVCAHLAVQSDRN